MGSGCGGKGGALVCDINMIVMDCEFMFYSTLISSSGWSNRKEAGEEKVVTFSLLTQ